jgi:transcriptional regulator GlxA family with amidase domain
MTFTIGIYVYDDVEPLDWAGPYEVLGQWAAESERDIGVLTIGRTDAPVTCKFGLRVLPDCAIDTAPALDLLVYPGGDTRGHESDDDLVSWVKGLKERGTLLTSVCSGAHFYARIGLLAGRPATSWWGSLDNLASMDPTIDVRRDERFVDDGDIVTSAGVSAGIDMALHLVARLESVERARSVRRYIQYDPEPPV